MVLEPVPLGRSISILSSSRPRREGRGERDRDLDGLVSRDLVKRLAYLPEDDIFLSPLRLLRRGGGMDERDLESEGLRRRRGGLMLLFLPTGVPLRLRGYLRGGDLERLRERDGERGDILRRLAGGGLRLFLALYRRSRSRGEGEGEIERGLRRLLGGGEREMEREVERRGGVGLRMVVGDRRLRGGGAGDRDRVRERELLSREGERRRGGDLILLAMGDRASLEVIDLERRRGGDRDENRRRGGPCKYIMSFF